MALQIPRIVCRMVSNRLYSSKKGFTLIELMIVISIISLLSIAGLVIYSTVSRNGRDAKRSSDLRSIQSALEQYAADQFYYPSTISLGNALTNCTGGANGCVVSKTYLNSVPNDPVSGNYGFTKLVAACDNTGATKCTSYCIYAKMENASNGVPVPSNCPGYNVTAPVNTYNFAVTLP